MEGKIEILAKGSGESIKIIANVDSEYINRIGFKRYKNKISAKLFDLVRELGYHPTEIRIIRPANTD